MDTKSLIAKMTLLMMVMLVHTFSSDVLANPTQASITAPSVDGTNVTPGSSVTFTGTGTDPDGLALTYTWSFSDGTTQTGQTVNYLIAANANPGTVITATLTLSDSNGNADTVPTRTVVVAALPIPANLVYVANYFANTVSVIDPSSNKMLATLTVNGGPYGRAISSDGKYTYITYPNNGGLSGSVSVFNTYSRLVTAQATVNHSPNSVAVTPDGSYSYATNFDYFGTVTVTSTATQTVTNTIAVGRYPTAIAITPDGTSAYVANFWDGTVSVINIASNTVTNTLLVGPYAFSVGNVYSTTSTPFSSFNIQSLSIAPQSGALSFTSNFTLGETSVGIAPAIQATILKIGSFGLTIPAGSFQPAWWGGYWFSGTFKGMYFQALLKLVGVNQYSLEVYAANYDNFIGLSNPVTVQLNIGGENGTTSANATILP